MFDCLLQYPMNHQEKREPRCVASPATSNQSVLPSPSTPALVPLVYMTYTILTFLGGIP